MAWALAENALSTADVDRRTRLQEIILDAVSDLPWWNTPAEPGTANAYAAIDRVH